jgi:hypothetical protein
MLRYLSAEWIEAVGRAASGVRVEGVAPLSIDHVVGEHRWHLVWDGASLTVGLGETGTATLRFEQDEATARAIAEGAVNAQTAFISGRLRITGDVERLIDSAPLFTALDAALAPVRALTEFDA